jgi:hypothetical protein
MYLDERLTSGIFKNQITTLIITIDPNQNDLSTMQNICNDIFTVFIKLTHLIFYESSYEDIVRLLFDFPFPCFSSSTLLVLKIKIQTFSQCLWILDGRFNQLQTLNIDLANIYPPLEQIENQVSLTNKFDFYLFSFF